MPGYLFLSAVITVGNLLNNNRNTHSQVWQSSCKNSFLEFTRAHFSAFFYKQKNIYFHKCVRVPEFWLKETEVMEVFLANIFVEYWVTVKNFNYKRWSTASLLIWKCSFHLLIKCARKSIILDFTPKVTILNRHTDKPVTVEAYVSQSVYV